ncbi:MAG: hypothetical protein Q7I98_03325, partial [Erysipelotrichaceae bacterium]|nr:hypothetical protein [Erysipelotrichaceae bacterium]
DDVMKLQDLIYDNLRDKDIFATDTKSDYLRTLEQGGFVLGVYVENKLISYRYVSFPGLNDQNLGLDLGMDTEALLHSANLETTVVHPDYRGNRLQKITLDHAVALVKEKGYYHLFSTVSPKNIFSLVNVMSAELKVKALKKKYGQRADNSDGKWRFILHRDLTQEVCAEYGKIVSLSLGDFQSQVNILNGGYIGHKLDKNDQRIVYAENDSCHLNPSS